MLKFSIPCTLSMVVGALYNTVDQVFIYAPGEYRVKRIMEVYGDTEDEAGKNIRHSDEAESAYYHSISGKKWGRETELRYPPQLLDRRGSRSRYHNRLRPREIQKQMTGDPAPAGSAMSVNYKKESLCVFSLIIS